MTQLKNLLYNINMLIGRLFQKNKKKNALRVYDDNNVT